MEERNHRYDLIYALMFLFFAFIIILPLGNYEGTDPASDFFGSSTNYDTGWHTEDGTIVALGKLNKVKGTSVGTEYSIYNDIPDSIQEGDALCFRCKNIFYQVYINGQLQYAPYVPESPIYNKSYGTNWSYIPIPVKAAGSQIEIRIRYVYGNSRACIDHIRIAKPGGVILNTIGEKMVAFITCVLILFVGLLLIIADIPINLRTQKNHELRYLGLFAISIAIWCTAETNLLQFYIGDSRTLQIVSCSSLMLIPIPTVLYLDTAFGFHNRFSVQIVTYLSILQYGLCWMLHFLGVADLHETLVTSHFMLALSAVILLFTIVRNTIVTTEKKSRNIYRILRTIGLCSISVATGADIIRFYHKSSSDSALCVRIGLLLFILCFGISSLEKTINAVRLGIQSEFVAQLAYRDGLTQIGNRTSFQEHLVDLEKVKDDLSGIGIIMFDVNDLKYVNDHMGHHSGDDMLVKSAELIQAAFQGTGIHCFRIGGDEFTVLLSSGNVQKCYQEGILKFTEKMKAYNEQPNKMFRLSIAHGFAVYDKKCKGTKLMDIYQQADKQMYENKKIMKANQIPPEEYYKGLSSTEKAAV